MRIDCNKQINKYKYIYEYSNYLKHKKKLSDIRNRKLNNRNSFYMTSGIPLHILEQNTNINLNTHKSNALSKWAPDYPFLRKDNFYYERRLIQSKPSISREQELTDYNNSLKYLGICRKFNKERVNIVKVFLQKNKSLPNIMNNKESNDSVLNNFMKKQQLKIQREMGERMKKAKTTSNGSCNNSTFKTNNNNNNNSNIKNNSTSNNNINNNVYQHSENEESIA